MFAALVEGLLPGLRSLRPPIFAGIGWVLLLWLVLADAIPSAEQATGWLGQVYDLAGAVGPVGLGVSTLVLVFIVGAIGQAITEPLSRLIGRITRPIVTLVRRSATSTATDEQEAIIEVRRDQLRSMLSQSNASGPMYRYDADIFDELRFDYGNEELKSRLARELGGDPLDALRIIDKDSFDDLQRERSERAVRIAMSFPLLGIAIYLSSIGLGWAALIAGALGLTLLLRYSANLDGEHARTMKLLLLRGSNTPALAAARSFGQYDLAAYLEAQRRTSKPTLS